MLDALKRSLLYFFKPRAFDLLKVSSHGIYFDDCLKNLVLVSNNNKNPNEI